MKNSYLIQRLQKPCPGSDDNPFNWGCGLLRGGINKDAYAIINQIFRFDYMGSAEFEFGAVPQSLDWIVKGFAAGDGVTGEISIHKIPIYYLCHKDQEAEVKERIKELAKSQRTFRTKESVMLDEALAARDPHVTDPDKIKHNKYYLEYIGWLELDNNFMFFLDKEAFDKFVSLLKG